MVHVHGAKVQQLVEQTRGVPPEQLLAVPIDAGKQQAMALVCDFAGELLVRPFAFAMNRAGVAELTRRVEAVAPSARCGRCGSASRQPATTTVRSRPLGCCRPTCSAPAAG
jgi:hypothetical protein